MKDARVSAGFSVALLLASLTAFPGHPGLRAGESPFLRGDVNRDGELSLADVFALVRSAKEGLPCEDAADVNDDGRVVPLSFSQHDSWDLLTVLYDPGIGDIYQLPPFPEAGADATPDALGCSSDTLEPPLPTDTIVEFGEVLGSPGAAVKIPVRITNSEVVEGLQLVICYDPKVFNPFGELGTYLAVNSNGTFWDGIDRRFSYWRHYAEPSRGILVLGIYHGYPKYLDAIGVEGVVDYDIPPGSDRLIFNIQGRVAPGAPPGSLVSLRLTNGEGGRGVRAPYNFKNEASIGGKARPIHVEGEGCNGGATENRPFLRGDVNADGRVSVSDAVMLRRWLYTGRMTPTCLAAGDVNADHLFDLQDIVELLARAFLGGAPFPQPFPQVGVDPDPASVGCRSYEVVTPAETDDVIRLGEVEAVPGETVEVPVFITSSVPVEGFQVVASFDPAMVNIHGRVSDGRSLVFDGTFYENHANGWPDMRVGQVREPGIFEIDVVGDLSNEDWALPAGTEVLAAKILVQVSPDAPPGSVVDLQLTNGPDGDGIRPPFMIRNELTHEGNARFVSVLPRRIAGKLHIVTDITFFSRGDSNDDGAVDISDALFTLDFLFLGGSAPPCPDAADADDNGKLELTDAVAILGELFTDTGGISDPYPARGSDRNADDLPPCHTKW